MKCFEMYIIVLNANSKAVLGLKESVSQCVCVCVSVVCACVRVCVCVCVCVCLGTLPVTKYPGCTSFGSTARSSAMPQSR